MHQRVGGELAHAEQYVIDERLARPVDQGRAHELPNKRVTSWLAIGAQVATFRKAARLTQVAPADQFCVGEDTIASIEQGRRPLQADFAGRLDELLDTKGVLQAAVAKVPQKERFPAFVQDFVEYEQEAVTLLSYQNQVVPGQLQTEAYARAVFAGLYPPLEDGRLEERVLDRLGRQKTFERKRDHRGVLPPCGRCRQVLLDYFPQIGVIIDIDGSLQTVPVGQLMPHTYSFADNNQPD